MTFKLLVGLGNPGAEYEDTRHNAGFWWLDRVAMQLKARFAPERAYFGDLARVNHAGQTLWLLKPQTYMNVSGKSVAALARFFKIEPEAILVAHDELDLAPGDIKLKQGGGHAGHNGLKDIHAQLGSSNYWRLRIGVGHPGERSEVISWVLKKPSPEHQKAIAEALDRAGGALPQLLDGDMAAATRRIHTKAATQAPKSSKPSTQMQ